MTAAALILAAALRAQYLMGTTCEIAAASDAQTDAAFREAKRIEQMLSTWIEDSELIRVNRGAQPGPELRGLLANADEWSRKTNGAFDPRWRAMAFGEKGYEAGAFGKGYALDRMLALTSGDAMIDFGGQLIVRGQREVAIADPRNRAKPLLNLTIENASLSTSGNSEQPGHIFDPRTGKSVRRGGSVSVIASDALTADILSTALFVMGDDEGLQWANANGVAAIFITDSNLIRRSARAPRRVTVLDSHYEMKD